MLEKWLRHYKKLYVETAYLPHLRTQPLLMDTQQEPELSCTIVKLEEVAAIEAEREKIEAGKDTKDLLQVTHFLHFRG